MDMMSYLEFLGEELTPAQKKQVDSWKRGDYSFSDKALDYKDKIRIPLIHHDDPTIPHSAVMDHLQKNGYQIHDYKAGLAKDKYGRPVKIGKALNKTAASDDIKKAFENDAGRAAKKSQNYHVVISRHPHDVAGMSTDRGWNSCMNMNGGINRRYLANDIQSGTHVAYLVHKDDDKIENPLARIALKQHTSESGHQVLRPEEHQYGTSGDSFAHTVRKWSEDNFPLNDKEVYHKNNAVYHDGGSKIAMNNSYETMSHVADFGLPEEKTHIANFAPKPILDHMVHDAQSKIFNHNDFRRVLIKRGFDDHLDLIRDHGDVYDKKQLLETYKRPADLDALAKDNSYVVRQSVAQHGTKRHHDALISDHSHPVREAVAEHGGHEHRDKLLNDPATTVRTNVALAGTSKHRTALLNDESDSVRRAIASKAEHLDTLVNDGAMTVRHAVARFGEPRHLDQLMQDHRAPMVKAAISANKEHGYKYMDRLMNDPDHEVRKFMARLGDKDVLDKLVRDPHPSVRLAVAEHGHDDHIQVLKDDPDREVRHEARIALENNKEP